jgi:hypothetical protein
MTVNSVTNSKYRLYYNDDGTPKFYTMEDLPGQYIAVDLETFERGRYDIVVKNLKVLSLSDIGTFRYVAVDAKTTNSICSDASDITILVSEDTPHIFWDYINEQ